MNAIKFLHKYFPAIFIKAQRLGIVGQALFDAGRLFEQHYGKQEVFTDGGGI